MKRMIVAAVLSASLSVGAATPTMAEMLWNDSGSALVLREGPGLGYLPIDTLEAGESVERGPCDEMGTWCVVSTDAIFGWVDTRVLEAPVGLAPRAAIDVTPLPPQVTASLPTPSLPGNQTAPVPVPEWPVPGARTPLILSTTEPMGNVTGGLLNLRAGPGTGAPVIGTLRPGEGGRVDVCDPSGEWCRISPPGMRQGWVKMRLIGLRRL